MITKDEQCDCRICKDHKGVPKAITVGIYTDICLDKETEEEWAEIIEGLEEIEFFEEVPE